MNDEQLISLKHEIGEQETSEVEYLPHEGSIEFLTSMGPVICVIASL